MDKPYLVGSRSSPLALAQVEEITVTLKRVFPLLRIQLVTLDTCGDKDRKTPLSQVEGSDFFTREIDEALLRGDIDFAVHSAKDLPDTLRDGLRIAAITAPLNQHDAIVSNDNLTLAQLPYGAKIGTSSTRRKEQILQYRPDLQPVDIRGNIHERIALLKTDNIDAVVVAACALIRLGLEERIAEQVPFSIMEPHPLQGALALVARCDDQNLITALSKVHHA